ncbi:protein TANC2-like isoform X1 [Puntigrus tetrazona]|uniref:protein TANC2-like isoform X1 n=1 Tax=Puntigrus tetrazona TaxID=1606681 RepID=UPI001C8A3F46|nr:protein TANC2-like isoform X1 [Puntigrus tetrazona]
MSWPSARGSQGLCVSVDGEGGQIYTRLPAQCGVWVEHGGLGPDLGPPPSVDEAANTLMTRLGFLLGEKASEGSPGPQYSMDEPDDAQGL